MIDVQETVMAMLREESTKHDHKPRERGIFYPSEALQCPRKIYYNVIEPPKDDEVEDMPYGLFHMGKYAETAIIVYVRKKFGDAIVEQERIDTLIAPGVTIHGYLDFGMKNAKGKLNHIFEVKSASENSYKYSAKALGPKPHHKAQLMCYMATKKCFTGSIIYVRRDDIAIIKQFDVEFDEEFWQAIVDNFKIASVAMEKGCPPPPVPIEAWECVYCVFKSRCAEVRTPEETKAKRNLKRK